MALNGSGSFSRLYNWVNDRDNGIKIRADRMDAEFDGIATALSTAIYKDGQQTVTANIPMGGFKFTGLAAGSSAGDSVRYEQITDGTFSATFGNVSLKSTDAGATAGPSLTLYRNSASPADDDILGELKFDGEDDGANQTTYGRIYAQAKDVTDTEEDGAVFGQVMIAGTLTALWQMDLSGFHVNDPADPTKQALFNLSKITTATERTVSFPDRDILLFGAGYVAKSAGYTVLAADHGKTIDCTAALTLTLTAAATLGDGFVFFAKANGGDVTIDPDGSETIDGASTLTVYDGTSAMILCDGTNFHTVINRRRVAIQVFTSSGTYTPSAGTVSTLFLALGAGGGGGGVNGATGSVRGMGGGGAGSLSIKLATKTDIGASQTVTIGAGGAGGVASGADIAGSAGGDTSVGSLCIGKGGSGGGAPNGGAGGIAGTGDITAAGSPGETGLVYTGGTAITSPYGRGASTMFGGPPALKDINSTADESDTTAYGAGGNGAAMRNDTPDPDGGAGGNGIVIALEFIA